MTAIDLDAIEKYTNAAEDGPWEAVEHPQRDDNPDGWPLIVIRSTTGKRREVAAVIEDDVASASECPRENAAFIAAARTVVPKMAAEIRALRADRDAHALAAEQNASQLAMVRDLDSKEIARLNAEAVRLRTENAAMLAVVRAAQAWAGAHTDRDVHRIRRPGALPAVANLYAAVERHRLIDLALTTTRTEQPETTR